MVRSSISAKIDFWLKVLNFIALVVGGLWAFHLYRISGSADWVTNINFETKVLPYHDDLRLLVVHVKTKNPRNVSVELLSKLGDSYHLRVRELPSDGKAGAVFEEDQKEMRLVADIDLLKSADGDYEILPGAEMDDMRVFVLPARGVFSLYAGMEIHNGLVDKKGVWETDFVGASDVVRIEL